VQSIVLSALGSLLAIVAVYALYIGSAEYCKSHRAMAECWWLKDARSFRFVIRNMSGPSNLTGIRFRVWMRTIIPSAEGISVNTFADTEVESGERLLLPKRQDLPLLCFRFEQVGSAVALLITDKRGAVLRNFSVPSDLNYLMFEYSARTRNWYLFKHEISRIYALPQYKQIDGERRNVFTEYLLGLQSGAERKAKSVLKFAEEITVTI
jgi:hypothetical protein